MYIKGLLVGLSVFLLIGVFHVIVVKAEYYLTKNVWPFFSADGLSFSGGITGCFRCGLQQYHCESGSDLFLEYKGIV